MIKTRWFIAKMMLMASFCSYVMRTNISINLVAMVENTNASLPKLPDYGPRYKWSEIVQGQILGIFYFGYMGSTLFGGTFAEKFGGRNVIGYTTLIGGMLTTLHPLLAAPQCVPTLVLRFLIGITAGACIPACHTLIAKWAPPDEKGRFLAALLGGALGTVITLPIGGLVIKHFNWKLAFYLEGLFCIIFAIIWFIFVTDDPNSHWLINEDEVKHITESIKQNLTTVNKIPPYIKMFTSIPYLALIILHFGNVWGVTFNLNYAPKYVHQVLQYDFTRAGFLSSLPILLRFIMAYIFGSIADKVRYKEYASVTLIRKCFCLTSHIIPGMLLTALALWAKEPWLALLLLTLSLGFNGSAVASNLQNAQDLAPNYAGTLFGVMEFFGNISGFIGTIVVSLFTKDDSTNKEWGNVFIIGGVIYIATALVFILFGSGETQSWNF